MSEYLDLIKIYYNEKLLFLTKDKHKKCNGCENDKQFKEIYGELVLNCGGKSGKCGDKIKINLPIYKSNKDLLYFKSSLENSINWEIISKYININEKDKSDNIKLKESYEKELSSIKELFNKYNSKNINTIKEKYSQIIELKNKSKTISNGMKLPENSANINVLKKEYIECSNEINKLTTEIREVNDTIEYYFMTEEPKIISGKYYKNEGPTNKKKKKEQKVVEPKKKDEPKPDLNKPKEDTLKKGVEVKWMSGNKELTGKIDNITSKSYMICCKPDGKMYRVKKELVSLNVEESSEEPVKEDSVETVGTADAIYYFSKSKDNKWLSTFNRGNSFEYNSLIYPTVEHAFHAQKLDPSDDKLEEYQKIFTDENLEPNEAKRLGGRKNFEENGYKLRSDWNDKRLEIMEECTESYYKENKNMIKRLIETGDKKLIHKGFRIDDFWGVNKNGGNNHHGKILMKLREKFSKVQEESQEGEPGEVEPVEKPVEITTGSKVKWSKDGKDLNGEVENITSKSYIICCKPDGKKYRVSKELVSLV